MITGMKVVLPAVTEATVVVIEGGAVTILCPLVEIVIEIGVEATEVVAAVGVCVTEVSEPPALTDSGKECAVTLAGEGSFETMVGCWLFVGEGLGFGEAG